MKKTISILCVLILMLSVIPVNAFAESYPANASEYEWEILKIANTNRRTENKMPLSIFTKLQSASDIRAADLVIEYRADHTRPDGKSCFTVIDDLGIDWFSLGENIAAGYVSSESVMIAWMNSEGHRKNIMNENYRHIGIGHDYYNADIDPQRYYNYWQQFFVGGCVATGIEIIGDASEESLEKGNYDGLYLKVVCDLHGDSYMPLECAKPTFKNEVLSVSYDGLSATKSYSGEPAPTPTQKPTPTPMPSPTPTPTPTPMPSPTPTPLPTPEQSTDTSVIFEDIPTNAWFKKHIDYVYKNGIFSGKSEKMFEPNASITRAEFVQVLANLSGIDTSDKNVRTKFSDVKSGQWFAPAIKWANEKGIVAGKSETEFDPNAKITREEMCVMLVNYASFSKKTLEKAEKKQTFSDDAKISSWAKERVYTCQMADIVNGKGANTFDPKGNATRAEAATLFRGFHEKYM